MSTSKKQQVVDHINRNPLDNRKSNLRIVTKRQNKLNVGPTKGKKYKGVFWEYSCNRWRAQITCEGKRQHIGVFKSEIEAAMAYDNEAKKLFGEHAFLNFSTPKSLFEACQQHANKIVKQVKDLYSPGGIVDDARNGSYGGNAPTLDSSMGQLSTEYLRNLPGFLNAAATGQAGADMTAARSGAATAPILNQSALTQLQQYGVPLAQAGAAANNAAIRSSALSGAQTQQDIMGKYAPELAQTYRNADEVANPEYYKTLGTATTGINNLVNSINLNGLSGSERSEVERSLGQSQTATGNLGLDNATNAVSNAMTFGSALQQKRDALGQALGQATNLMGASKSGFNPMQTLASSSSGGPNLGTSNFTGNGSTGNQAWNFGNNTMNNMTSLANTQMGTQWASNQANSFGGILGSQTSAVGNVCCFIFLESCNGVLPAHVRFCRDYFYDENPDVAVGYKRMAAWLVPMMRRSPSVKSLVNRWMVAPMIRYGRYLTELERPTPSRVDSLISAFWFNVWKRLS